MKHAFFVLSLLLIPLFSCHKNKENNQKAIWIKNAFESLESGTFPKVKAISWWDENFDNSKLKINSSAISLEAYRAGVQASTFITEPLFEGGKLIPDTGMEDIVTQLRINKFEESAGKEIVWAYFSNNWYNEINFPTQAVETILSAGRMPFIRMMPRSNFDEGGPDPQYFMQAIIDGDFDAELTIWAQSAAAVESPLLVEFGTEVNGNWFPWNGQYNGGEQAAGYGNPNLSDGPERFRDAYRHIINLFDENEVSNITWFFHIDAYGEPDADWNKIANYYPGDAYIDWLGVSVYGPQEKGEDYQEFSEILSDIYPQLTALSDKPIAVLEFAVTEL